MYEHYRNDFLRAAADHGVPQETIIDVLGLLGHEKIETTMIYARTCMESVQAGHRKYIV